MDRSRKPRFDSLRGQVYQYLHDRIQDGKLRAGQKIDLDALATSLGVSRTPLREAFILLGAEGFVTILPRSGISINSLAPDDIRNLYEVIGALEGAVLRTVGNRLEPAGIGSMDELNHGMEAAIREGDIERFHRLNLDFHSVYLDLSRNAGLLKTIDLSKRRLYDFSRKRELYVQWEMSSIREHDRIVALLGAGDFRGAAEYVRDVHWSFDVQEKYIRQYYGFPADGAAGTGTEVG